MVVNLQLKEIIEWRSDTSKRNDWSVYMIKLANPKMNILNKFITLKIENIFKKC